MVLIIKGFKYELDLNNKQKTSCLEHAGAARWAYNFGLSRKIEEYSKKSKAPTAVDLHRELNVLKKSEIPWMYNVSKCAPQEALRNLDKAFSKFFKKKARFPKFKTRKKGRNSFRLTGSIHAQGNMVQLPRLGKLRIKEESNVIGRILSATVSSRAGRWFVSIQTEMKIDLPDNQGESVGVDLGINVLATLSDGTTFANPRAERRKSSILRRAQRILSRRTIGSGRRRRAASRVSRIYYKISSIRIDAIHKMTTFIAKKYSLVGIEDLNVSGMMKNRRLAKAIGDASFGLIRRFLAYKCHIYGGNLVVHNRFMPSSKTCSMCGKINKLLTLSNRTFRCGCGNEMDRDLNASINLRPRVPRLLRVEPEALSLGNLNQRQPWAMKREQDPVANG